jgi:hypothetical protein
MKSRTGSVRKAAKPKRKAAGTSRASKPRTAGRAGKAAASDSREPASGAAASRLIDQRIRELGGWRGETLARMRALILAADRELVEEWKWRGTPVWSRHGIVCTGEAYAKAVKLTFARGAEISDPAGLFNASLEGNTRRAIDIREGDTVDARALKALVKAAVARNGAPAKGRKAPAAASSAPGKAKPKPAAASRAVGGRKSVRPSKSEPKRGAKAEPEARAAKPRPARKTEKGAVVLLAGGNPQIAKADGDAPVQAYLDALPGWKGALAKRLDALIARSVPGVCKAVKWNSPFYGVEGQGFFLGLHAFTHYLKLAFFRGASLQPAPPGPSKDENTRYLDIREGDELDEAQLTSWFEQAAALPGWVPGRPS